MRHLLLAILALFALLISSNHLCFAQTNPSNPGQIKPVQAGAIDKFKEQVEKIGTGKDITVIRLDGKEFYGSVGSIEADGFYLYEVDSKQTINFKYTELKKVRKGYGGKGFMGKRVNKKRSYIVGAAFLGGLFLLVAIALSLDKS